MNTSVIRRTTLTPRSQLPIGIALGCALLSVGLFFQSAASANTPIQSFEALPSNTQAGGHPDLGVFFSVKNRRFQHSQSACDCEDAKDSTFHLPAGFIGNPHATPQCTTAEFGNDECPVDSQVGVANIYTNPAPVGGFISAVYNLVPPPGVPGLTGFKVFDLNTPVFQVLSGRTGSDYGLDTTVKSIPHAEYPLEWFKEVLWGVPADPSHDNLRINPATNPHKGSSVTPGELCATNGSISTGDPNTMKEICHTIQRTPPTPSSSPLTPFLQNPTNCASPLSSSLNVLSYDGGETQAEYPWPQATGCDQLSFNPSLYAQPTTTETDSASGIDVDLSIPQEISPTVPSPSELKAATVTLPPGFSINPNAADGKTSCSDLQARFGTTEEAQCPEFSKVGSLTIDDPALPGPLPGFVYLGEPLPGNRYRIFQVADGFGIHLKLPGTVTPDPQTGQLKATFENLPQNPLSGFNLHFFGSERGLLATPTQCGTYPVTSTFVPWDESLSTQTSTQFFTLTSGPNGTPCPGPTRPFNPSLHATSTANAAGAHSPFSLEIIRNDGDQNLSALNVSTPPGFSATLAGIPYCPDAALAKAASSAYSALQEEANPSCPAASQIGTAVTGAGAGTHPVYTPGKVYLAGPYKGAPLSLAVITPAISGPYDLGNAVVRAALHVNPETAQITAVSDPLPQILEGIPLRLREIRINLNRPEFTLNPTNCDPFSVNAEIFGDQGAMASRSSHFQVANCAALPFAPKLAMGFSGSTVRAGNPTVHADLSYPSGGPYANVSHVAVTLPPTEIVDNAHINNPCTKVQFFAGNLPGEKCPAGSDIGFAKAQTPILEKPLEGPVYLRTGGGHKLPDIVAALNGQIDIALDGHVDTVYQKLHGEKVSSIRTTFEAVPDAPVSNFTLTLDGGNKGLLQNNTNLCKAPLKAVAKIIGQNGLSDNQSPELQTPCGSKARHKRHSQLAGAVR